jgi:hypothetical protein
MNKPKSWIVLIIVVLAFLTHGSSIYSITPIKEMAVQSLEGLSAIYVVVEHLNPEIEGKGGLTSGQIQTDIELKLRMAGIKIASTSGASEIPGMPFLYVKVSTMSMSLYKMPELYACNINISLNQWVYLSRDLSISAIASTWERQFFGTVGISRIGSIRDVIKDKVDIFINDYLSVNPK